MLLALALLTLTSVFVQGGLAPLCLLPGCGLAPRPWTVLPPWADMAAHAAALACMVLAGLLQAHLCHMAYLELPRRPSHTSLSGTFQQWEGGQPHVTHPASWQAMAVWALVCCGAGVGGYMVFGLWVADDALVSFNLEDLEPLTGSHWLALVRWEAAQVVCGWGNGQGCVKMVISSSCASINPLCTELYIDTHIHQMLTTMSVTDTVNRGQGCSTVQLGSHLPHMACAGTAPCSTGAWQWWCGGGGRLGGALVGAGGSGSKHAAGAEC